MLKQGLILNRDFFARNSIEVARDLLGQILVFNDFRGIITETESYRGNDDPASHAFKGPTNRSKIMFGKPGISYVYLIYGIYNCLNVVTEEIGNPSAVLIRGLKLITPEPKLLDGPGKICKTLGITREHNNIDLINNENLYIIANQQALNYNTTSRIGITKGIDKPWRFIIKE